MKDDPDTASDPGSGSAAADAELMYVRCAGCGDWMDVKPGQMNLISHSYCPKCFAEEMRKLSREEPG